MGFSLEDLDARVAVRAAASPEESYTAKLIAAGIERSSKKFGEEAVELVIAAVARDAANIRAEAADVLYHLLVVLKAADVPLSAVMEVLEARTAQSGLAEKAARPKGTV